MNHYALPAIQSALRGKQTFCKFITSNDIDLTKKEQNRIHIPQLSASILFGKPGVKGKSMERLVKIQWQDGTETESLFVYDGRNDYHIANFDREFPYLQEEYTGALFVLVQNSMEKYQGFFLNTEDEIDQFLYVFGISATETNRSLNITEIDNFVSKFEADFSVQ